MSKRKYWYMILGISKTASAADIKRAYKRLALQCHPDKTRRFERKRKTCFERSLLLMRYELAEKETCLKKHKQREFESESRA